MLANVQAQIPLFFQTYGIVAVLLIILAVGIWRTGLRLLTARLRARTAGAFRERFQAFANSGGEDTAAYDRIAFLAEHMGSAMGVYAQIEAKPPFGNLSSKNFSTILQFIPELRRHFADIAQGGYGLGNDGASWIYYTVDDALIRYIGSLDGATKTNARRLLNPIAWFMEGVERILALPFYVLSWFGLMEPANAGRTERHGFFRAISSVTAVLVVVFIASTLIFGEQRTNTASRSIYRDLVEVSSPTINNSLELLAGLAGDVSRGVSEPTSQPQQESQTTAQPKPKPKTTLQQR